MEKGFHLTVDGFGCEKKPLSDLETVYHFLDRAPDLIGMKKLMPPMTIRYRPPKQPAEWGVTGFVVVAESHISIHTYPDRRYLALDIYSCKEFDLDSVICYARQLFGIAEMTVNYLDRGLGTRGEPGNCDLAQIFGRKKEKRLDKGPAAL